MPVALVSLGVAGAAWSLGPPGASARSFSSARVPGHGLLAPALGAGGGPSIAGIATVAAILTATVAFGMIGWRYDRRRLRVRSRRRRAKRGSGPVRALRRENPADARRAGRTRPPARRATPPVAGVTAHLPALGAAPKKNRDRRTRKGSGGLSIRAKVDRLHPRPAPAHAIIVACSQAAAAGYLLIQ